MVKRTLGYIGSKRRLIAEIDQILTDGRVPGKGGALDLFSGTGVVSQLLKTRGYRVWANDWQYYAYVMAMAYIMFDEVPTFSNLALQSADQVLDYLNQLPGHHGPFVEAYCEIGLEGRHYFSMENGYRIQAIRDQIQSWHYSGQITVAEHSWLVACLIEAIDKVANTASVYGAYLKAIKPVAKKPFMMTPVVPVKGAKDMHRAFCKDSMRLIHDLPFDEIELTYVDPPYNQRQYAVNYHVLETVARWDLHLFKPRGQTGLRDSEENSSLFCLKKSVFQAMMDLMAHIQSPYLLVSYNNEGLLNEDQLRACISPFFDIEIFRKIPYHRFTADQSSSKRTVSDTRPEEFLILAYRK